MGIKYNLEPCYICGNTPQGYYDNDQYDSLYNIECCGIHIRDYRVATFKKWNKLMINTRFEKKEVEVLESITCDICNTVYEDELELQEFHHIDFVGGYNSVFGDMNKVCCDICQHCLKILLKDKFRYEDY